MRTLPGVIELEVAALTIESLSFYCLMLFNRHKNSFHYFLHTNDPAQGRARVNHDNEFEKHIVELDLIVELCVKEDGARLFVGDPRFASVLRLFPPFAALVSS